MCHSIAKPLLSVPFSAEFWLSHPIGPNDWDTQPAGTTNSGARWMMFTVTIFDGSNDSKDQGSVESVCTCWEGVDTS